MTKRLYLFEEIKEESIRHILQEIHETKENEDIELYICCNGGCLTDALALASYIEIRPAITTIAFGYVASSAIYILVAGNKRKAISSTRFYMHRRELNLEDHYSRDALIKILANGDMLDTLAQKKLRERTKMPEKIIESCDRESMFFGIEEALEWGIVHEII